MDLVIIGVVGASIAIYAMVDLSMRRYEMKTRMIWFPIVILIPIIGPLVYFFKRGSLA